MRNAQHKTCYMQHATCNMQHATCSMLHATCYMQHAACYTQNAWHAFCVNPWYELCHYTYWMLHMHLASLISTHNPIICDTDFVLYWSKILILCISSSDTRTWHIWYLMLEMHHTILQLICSTLHCISSNNIRIWHIWYCMFDIKDVCPCAYGLGAWYSWYASCAHYIFAYHLVHFISLRTHDSFKCVSWLIYTPGNWVWFRSSCCS